LNSYHEFKEILENEGGFILAHWCGKGACEKQINAETGASIRVIPFDSPEEEGKCLIDGQKSMKRVLLARAY
jgi:prolyl-tRNA synthetase